MNRAERRIIAARIRRRLDRVFAQSLHQVYSWQREYTEAEQRSLYRSIRCNEGRKYNWYRGLYFERDCYVWGRLARLSRESTRLDTEYRFWLNGDFDD